MDIRPVLNVDDHAPARFLRTRILQRAGFGVDEVDSAAGAIERAATASLLLLDVKLPDGDGFSVCEAVKRAAPTLPVVMVTSVYRTAQARRDAFAVGADAFLLEPIAPEQLVRTIETLLKRKVEPGTALGEAWAVTDALGDILEISAEAAKMLNLSARGLRGRNLPAFITDNRPRLLSELLRASEGLLIDRMSTLQPRDRRPMRVHLDVSALPADAGERVRLRWILSPESR
ncbi:MAG TPA: response regulator [Vicinamibacterales bacterium]|jgi:DNA-binding response OmpR family regulator|nr:response regulator [Vicinamibacterales bacterium]